MKWILERAKERSTWIGLIALTGVAGVQIEPEQANNIATGATLLASAFAVGTADQ